MLIPVPDGATTQPPRGPQFTPHGLVRTLWKRKGSIFLAAVFLCGTGLAITWLWPAEYKAEAVILVDAQRIPQQYVSDSVQRNLQDRLATLTQQVMSINRLQHIIDTFDLYSKDRKRLAPEEVIERMRRDAVVRLERGWTREQPGAFRVAYIAPTPVLAADVANEVASLFIAENLRDREASAEGTTEFMRDQLANAKKRLDELEADIGEYKRQHNGELPQQENVILTKVSRLQLELQANQDEINRAQQNKSMLESMLVLVGSAKPDRGSTAETPEPPPPGPGEQEQIERALELARAQYTERHPDVVRLKERLEIAARSQAAVSRNAVRPRPAQRTPTRAETEALVRERERVGSFQVQLNVAQQQIEVLETNRKRILEELSSAQARLERLPMREQQIAAVTRDYEIAKANYRSLLDKKFAAEMSTDMERRQKSERFTILDAARPPGRSFRPDRLVWGLASCAAGLVLAIAFGFVREAYSGVVLGEWELAAQAPILGRVPRVPQLLDRRRKGRRWLPVSASEDSCAPDSARAGRGVSALVTRPYVAAPPAADSVSRPAFPSVPTASSDESPISVFKHGPETAIEQYRIIRTKILHHGRKPRAIVISSGGAGDGKTVTAINVAAALALKDEEDVLLVEADFRRPRVARLLALGNGPGLAEILNGVETPESAILTLEGFPRLHVLRAGDAGEHAAELLDCEHWRMLCARLRRMFGFVIFDAPPIGPVADYDLVQIMCDGVVVVVRPDHTKRAALDDALANTPEDKLIGVVLNDVPKYIFTKHHSYYDYAYTEPVAHTLPRASAG